MINNINKSFSKNLMANIHLIRNAFWSLSGSIAPLFAAVFCIPFLLQELGEENFGFLAIAWMVVGYFSLFDLGIGRGLTYIVSRNNSKNIDSASVTSASLKFLIFIGSTSAVFLYGFSHEIAGMLIKHDNSPDNSYENALKIISLAIPCVVLTAGVKGVLEAHGEFKMISLIAIPTGVLMFVAPVVVLLFTSDLTYIFISLVTVRFFQLGIFIYFSGLKNYITFRYPFTKAALKEVLVFSGWITVSNVISPLMAYMDRFFIGARLGLDSVSYYVIPFDVISKVKILPRAILSILFPEFTKANQNSRQPNAKNLMTQSMLAIFLILLPPLSIIYVFSFEIMALWIDSDFAKNSSGILEVLCIGFMINCIAFVPFGFVQSKGRSDITAMLHMLEAVLYFPVLIFLMDYIGIMGAAISWSLRVLLDLVVLLYLSYFKL